MMQWYKNHANKLNLRPFLHINESLYICCLYGHLLGLWTNVARDTDRYGSLIKILVRFLYKIRF